MQSIILIAIMVILSSFFYMETNRNDVTTLGRLETFQAANIASNIMQYNDLLTQYTLAHYAALHDASNINDNRISQISKIDYINDHVSQYSQKDLVPFLNYTVAVFNYGTPRFESQREIATLYLVNSFSEYIAPDKRYQHLSLDQVMGELAQKYSRHLYQGDSSSWVIPWLIKQDGNCSINEIFSQTPNSSDGNKAVAEVTTIFTQFCQQLKTTGYVMQQYVYLAPVYKTF